MSPKKPAFDNQPTVVDRKTRVPGRYGWGVDREHLIAQNKIITDDTRVSSYPIKKVHLKELDEFQAGSFVKFEGDRAAVLDSKLGTDYNLYNALNMRAQRATLKCLEANRKINSSIPNKASGLGSVDAMNQKLQNSSMVHQSVDINTNHDFNSGLKVQTKSPYQIGNTQNSFGVSTSADSKLDKIALFAKSVDSGAGGHLGTSPSQQQ